ncbi:MAG: 3-hydroxyacyl-CoA dehydrogenase family protein [Bacteroidota bacterium]
MKILARGEKIRTEELKQKLYSVEIDWVVKDDTDFTGTNLHDFDIIFDLNFDDREGLINEYAVLEGKPVFVSAAKKQLAQCAFVYDRAVHCRLFGLNALPTFINRSLAEVTMLNEIDKDALMQVMTQLQWDYKLVEDRVGMVTPRIVMMIINEACYTVQEGTATMKDIDTSMKLGTNYPHGPFEWSDAIGIRHVYEVLNALYEDTKDERYKICSLLKTKYLKRESFYH